MNLEFLNESDRVFSLSVFLPDTDVAKFTPQLEPFGDLDHVHMVVQPCPYEGIEFLYRADMDFDHQLISADREIFWHAIELPKTLDSKSLASFSEKHYAFFIAILNQDVSAVAKLKQEIESLLASYY